MKIDAHSKINFGKLIASKRIEKNLTQEEIAKGICSIPYLSKIENSKIDPNDEVVYLLCQKVGINPYILETEMKEFKNLLVKLYNSINDKDQKNLDAYWKRLNDLMFNVVDPDLKNYYLLISFRYYLYKKETHMSFKLKMKLEKIKKTFSHSQLFYFHYFIGLFYCIDQDYSEGINEFLQALDIYKEKDFSDKHLYFHLALSYSHIFNSPLAIQYAKEAADMFQQDLNIRMLMDCQIILGINYTRLKHYEKAWNHFDSVLKVAKSLNDQKTTGKALHNIAYMYSRKEEHDKSIHYYIQSLEHKEENDPMYVNTIFFLAEELLKIDNLDLANEWIEKGISLSKDFPKAKINYLKLMILKLSITGNSSYLITFIENNCIPFFKEKHDSHHLHYCYEKLGDLYFNLKRYKNSSKYYKLAINANQVGGI